MFLLSLFGTNMTAFSILGASGHAFANGIVTYGLMASSSALIIPVGIFAIGGSDPNYILSFAVVAAGGGTFVIPGADRQTGENAQSAGNNALLITVVNNVAQSGWAADFTKGSGTIVLTSLSAAGASIVFS